MGGLISYGNHDTRGANPSLIYHSPVLSGCNYAPLDVYRSEHVYIYIYIGGLCEGSSSVDSTERERERNLGEMVGGRGCFSRFAPLPYVQLHNSIVVSIVVPRKALQFIPPPPKKREREERGEDGWLGLTSFFKLDFHDESKGKTNAWTNCQRINGFARDTLPVSY